jgi:isoleucyl-tRNA synthetase
MTTTTTTTRDDQQHQRSTARRDQLTSYQTIAQKSWSDSKVFEVQSDETKPIKFFGNFPYPYMNGLLHLGHAFSLSKLVRFFSIIIRAFILF